MKGTHKIALSIFGALLILSGGMFVLLSRKSHDSSAALSDPSLVALTNTESDLSKQSEDYDNDSLSDWEEGLWKTDPKKADSDGDGTSDGDEVKADRDPLKKGPEDKLEGKTALTEKKILTPTEALARDILIAHYKLTTEGLDDPEFSIESILSKNTPELTTVIYSSSQFNTSPDDLVSVQRYATELAAMLNKYTSPTRKSELEILGQATEESKEELVISQLAERSADYKTMAEAMLAMHTPKNALTMHVELANTLSTMAAVVGAMSKITSDPVTALAGIQKYPETGLILSKNLNTLILYLQSRLQFTAP